MTDKEPQPSIIPNFEADRATALGWVHAVASDTELDGLVVSPEGAAAWQRIMGEHLHDVAPEDRELATQQWRRWYQPQLDEDAGVRGKNLLLAQIANEVEEELSGTGIYLRGVLSEMQRFALTTDEPSVTMRAQFMRLWTARKMQVDSEGPDRKT